jgi:hypothetical protein
MSYETGESTAVLHRRSDDEAWARLLPAMRRGALITRPSSKLRTFYVDGDGGFQPAFIARLEREGIIKRVGVDTYALVEARADG